MAKDSIPDFSATSSSNTDIQSVNIDEGCPASNLNNAIRELMVDLKNVDTGAVALTSPSASQLNVDNLRLDGNTISSTDTNGDITLDPNGTGVTAITGGFTATDGCTITTADNTVQLTLKSTDADANNGPILDMVRDSSSPADGDEVGVIRFKFDDDAGESNSAAQIQAKISDASNGTEDGTLEILTLVNGSSRKMIKIKPTEVVINEDSQDVDFRVESDDNANMLFVDAGNDRVGIGTAAPAHEMHIQGSSTTASLSLKGSGTGTAASDGIELKLQGDNSAYLYNYENAMLRFGTNGLERVRITSDGKVGIGTSSPSVRLDAKSSGEAAIGIGSTNAGGAVLYLDGDSNGDYAGTDYSYIQHDANGRLNIVQNSPSGTNQLRLYTGNTERMRLDSSGNFMHAMTTTSPGLGNTVVGTAIRTDGIVAISGASNYLSVNRNSDGHLQQFNRSGTTKGTVSINTSGVNYNTTSDYRLKEAVTPITNATDRLKQLNPVRFNFIADPDTTVDGFLAHEVSDIVPEAISGEKDAMKDEQYEVTPAVFDDDGNEVTPAEMGTRTVPDYQGIDQSKLVPLLVATIQELEARIAALEA